MMIDSMTDLTDGLGAPGGQDEGHGPVAGGFLQPQAGVLKLRDKGCHHQLVCGRL